MLKKLNLLSFILSVSLVVTLSMSGVQALAASDDSSKTTVVSISEARNVAINQIVGDMQTTNNTNWKPGVKINKSTALFDLDNNPSAYLFELKDKQGNDNGYIVVSASKTENPIIEYSYQGSSFFNIAKSVTGTDIEKRHPGKKVKEENFKLYYLGEGIYFDEFQLDDNTKQAYDISTSEYTPIIIDDLKKIKLNKSTDNQYFKLWDFLSKNHVKQQQGTGGTNPPDDGSTYITNPSQYESGCTSSSSRDVTGYNLNYSLMSSFGSGGVCAPTAATNMCRYWYTRSSKYSNLLGPTGWQGTYNSFYSLMGTDPVNGTYDNKVAPAYQSYFANVGLSCNAYYYTGTNYGQAIINEVNNDRPSHLMMHNHKLYGNHSVVALGYQQYAYSGNTSNYIRIADGWITSPTRYVWGGCYGNWNYVSVIPN